MSQAERLKRLGEILVELSRSPIPKFGRHPSFWIALWIGGPTTVVIGLVGFGLWRRRQA